MLVSALVALVVIVRASTQANAQTTAIQADVRRLRQEQQVLEKQAETVRQSLTTQQLQSLRAAHELVDRKQFSWTRLFSDLESALPGAVMVTRISVRDVAARQGQTFAELDLTVVAKSSITVTDMIADMDRAGIFRAELRAQNLQKGRGETGTEYELTVVYTPRAGAPAVDAQAARVARVDPDAQNLKEGSK